MINALSDLYHPCQAFADFFTLEEHFGGLRGLKLAYVGDGNNVCHSLMVAGSARRARMCASRRPQVTSQTLRIVAEAKRDRCARRAAKSNCSARRKKRSSGAQAVYTDVWASMGQEEESRRARTRFSRRFR